MGGLRAYNVNRYLIVVYFGPSFYLPERDLWYNQALPSPNRPREVRYSSNPRHSIQRSGSKRSAHREIGCLDARFECYQYIRPLRKLYRINWDIRMYLMQDSMAI